MRLYRLWTLCEKCHRMFAPADIEQVERCPNCVKPRPDK